jgi:mannose-6-phosphate isomerase-like protein (cupin superfamily)
MKEEDMFIDWEKLIPVELAPGAIQRQVELDGLFVALQEFSQPTDPSRPWKLHSHPHQQAGQVLEGVIELRIGDETYVLKEGDAYCIPSNAEHGVRVLKPLKLLGFYVCPSSEYVDEYRAKNSPTKEVQP